MATDRLFNQSQGEELLSILEQIRDGYNSVDSQFSKTSENPIQNKVLTGALTDVIETLGGTAQGSYSIGRYFLANDGYYYVATAAITAGSSTINTGVSGNCSKTSIAAGMNDLVSQISNLQSNKVGSNKSNLSMFVPNSWSNIYIDHENKEKISVPANGDRSFVIDYSWMNIPSGFFPIVIATPYSFSNTWAYCTCMISSLSNTNCVVNVHNMESQSREIAVSVLVMW